MVVIGGRYPLGEEETMPLQELHGVPLMQSITKWSRSVSDPARIPEYVALAFHHARSGRQGPVFLEIPADVLAAKMDPIPCAGLPRLRRSHLGRVRRRRP